MEQMGVWDYLRPEDLEKSWEERQAQEQREFLLWLEKQAISGTDEALDLGDCNPE